MLSALRNGLKHQIFQCKYYFNRQIFSGFTGPSRCIVFRNLYDSDKPFINTTPKNAEILRARYCHEPKKPIDCPPPPPPDEKNLKGKLPWLAALITVGGIGIFYYFRSRDGNKSALKTTTQNVLTPLVKVPSSSADIPKEVPYLLIGGGTASFSAFRAIKSHDPKAKVLVISNEYEKPYMRPPLSKELWYHAEPNVIQKDFKFQQWNGAQRSLFYEPEEFYIDPTKLMDNPNGGVAICQGYTVKKIDVCDKKVILSDGAEIFYGECLIATGCSPKLTDVFEVAPLNIKDKISTFRTTRDYEMLKNLVDSKKSITVVGSGFLGSELSCALAKYGGSKDVKIFQVFHESGNMARVLPEYLSKWTTEQVQQQGVCVIPGAQIDSLSISNNQLKLTLSNGKSLLTDHVVVCLGCDPNTEIAQSSNLETDPNLGGFVVNAELAARRHLYVAGDAASFYDPLLGRRRVEHHDHSVVSGRLAGENMVGLKKPFVHQSMFWSDLGPRIGYEGIGLVDSTLQTVGIFTKASEQDVAERTELLEKVQSDHAKSGISDGSNDGANSSITKSESKQMTNINNEDNYGKGVIFYLRDDKIVGILLWNLFNRISIARKIINENKKFDDLNEVAKLFEIHS